MFLLSWAADYVLPISIVLIICVIGLCLLIFLPNRQKFQPSNIALSDADRDDIYQLAIKDNWRHMSGWECNIGMPPEVPWGAIDLVICGRPTEQYDRYATILDPLVRSQTHVFTLGLRRLGEQTLIHAKEAENIDRTIIPIMISSRDVNRCGVWVDDNTKNLMSPLKFNLSLPHKMYNKTGTDCYFLVLDQGHLPLDRSIE